MTPYRLFTKTVQDWHPFTWLFHAGIYPELAIDLESWGWFIEWTPAFIGSGMLVGMNVAISYFVGTLLAWFVVLSHLPITTDSRRGIVGPILVSKTLAFGTPASQDSQWALLVNYASLSSEFTTIDHPSPRYWLLWPGVLCMIFVSFTGLLPSRLYC